MASIGEKVCSCAGIPNTPYLYTILGFKEEIAVCRSNARAIWGPRDSIHCAWMSKGNDACGSLSIPDLHRCIIAGRSDIPAIWRPGYARYHACMPGVG